MRIGRIALIVLLLAVGFAVTPSMASCAGYLMSTWGAGTTGVYNYVHLGWDPATNPTTFSGSFWLAGAKGTFNNGTYPVSEWLVPYPVTPATPNGCPDCYYIYANTGDGRVLGCSTPTNGNVYVQIEALGADGRYKSFSGGVDAIYVNAVVWDFSRINLDWNMVSPGPLSWVCVNPTDPLTCPTAPGKAPAGTVYSLRFTAPSGLGQAYAGNIPNPTTTWSLLSKLSPTATNPGTGTSGWTTIATAPLGQTIDYSFDTAALGGEFIFFAGQSTFDGGNQAPAYVGGTATGSGTTAFRPAGNTLANPKFKNIDKKPKK